VKTGSLVGRLTLLQQLVAAVLIVTFAASAVWISARTLERQEATFLHNAALQMAESLRLEWGEEHDLKRAAASVLEEEAPLGVRIDILDEQGHTLASTARGSRQDAHDLRTTRLHVEMGAWIVASMSTRHRRNALEALSLALILAAVPLLVAASVLGRWLSRRALQPLSRMASEAERITARGAVRPLGSPSDPEEVATLAASFDRLIQRLDEMIRAEQHFTEDAAHELRTPLTVLSGELEYALSDPALSSRQREGLQRASVQVRAMSELVEALLFLRGADNGREGQSAEFAPVNLADLARDSVGSLLLQSPQRARDVVTDADDEVLVNGHSVLLASALRNLISNAIKFTEPGQGVRVTVRASDGQRLVVVEDGGRGVAAEDRESIFDAFYRSPEARASKAGFGLGLPILRRVARAHGGDVVISSSALGGARFELRLPAWTPKQ